MRLVTSLLFIFLIAPPLVCASQNYEIDATYQQEEHQIVGQEKITFSNQSTKPVSELYIFLYPNLYRRKHPDLDTQFYRKAYPINFNSAGIEIHSLKDASGETLPFFPSPYQNSIIIKINLSKPVEPLDDFDLFIKFTTKIPQKWGPFGYYDNLIALQGGWYPYLANFIDGEWTFHDPPQESRYRIRFNIEKNFEVIGSTPLTSKTTEGDLHSYLFEGENLSFFSLSIGDDFVEYKTSIGKVDITYHVLSRDRAYAEQVVQLTENALTFFTEESGAPPPMFLQMTSAGLYQDLTTPGDNLLYLNTHLFKVFPTLKRFHEASLAYGLYRIIWRKKRPEETWWVIESLARIDAEAFMKNRHGKTFNLSEWLKPIAFIPLIDQILYSNDLPMRQVYFKESLNPVVSEDIRFFNNPPSESPSIFTKLRNLIGDESMDQTLSAYLTQKDEAALSFRKILNKTTGEDLDWLIDRWLTVRTKLDFELLDIQQEEINGTYHTSIDVLKHGEGIEPLQVTVREKNGSVTPLVWDGVGDAHRFVLTTQTAVHVVDLDPNKLSNDPNRLNNRSPPKWKFLLDQFNLSYDFQTKFLSYNTGLLFQRVYDTRNWVRLQFSHADAGDSQHLSYTHSIKRNHIITTGLTHTKTKADLQLAQKAEESQFVTIGYDFVFPDIPLLPESVQRLTTTFPTFDVGLTFNQELSSGSTEHAALLRLNLRRVFSFSNYHEIGGRIFIGQSIGRLFEDNRFFLGGSNGMRGYTPLAFEGENMSLFSVEYRFPLFYETDINFLGLVHTHTWQAVLFSDAGMVTDSHNVFRFDQYKSDIGFGLRFFVDLFGVYPSILRADIAKPIDGPRTDEDKIHYYLNVGHSF